ncbi:zinc metalloproteinase [Pseudozyma hubeiensis SY62]|uniref:Zinc metalloproteinase n=1 Tax=Pseudozyma hubeiensis (strain SY62) TaxID=1305764 RepID=R9P4H2_PSEHS|nr:zinc metalloproteinase [Pseudozyma hubeiensis SY62]GAC96204.1 zinc metalloproteinase [Pseudozyma hubeiensis SY62]
MVPPPAIPPRPHGSQQPPPYAQEKSTVRFTNLQSGETVFTRLLIVEGTVDSTTKDGSITVSSDSKSGFKPERWEINQGYFKALVPLVRGCNNLTFEAQLSGTSETSRTTISVTYDRPANAPPLHLAIVAACDSPVWNNDGRMPPSVPLKPGNPSAAAAVKEDRFSRFLSKAMDKLDLAAGSSHSPVDEHDRALVDTPPGPRREAFKAGGLHEVKRRIALQAYLWQAFHSEQMRRHGMGRRAFQLDDEASFAQGERSLELLPRVHLIKSRRTLREFRDPENAQQKPNARNGGAMHAFAAEALEDPSTPRELHWSPVAVLTLDTIWDPKMRLLRAHGAVGAGGPGSLSHGVMGSHWLWAAPRSLDQVTAAFLDTEATDESCCVNDLDECPTAWQTLNIGSGAFFHEAGHAMNQPHWPTGLMARGYIEFSRAFMTREPGCKRNRVAPGRFFAPIHAGNDDKHNHVHRAQAVRARWHPCFVLPSDPILPYFQPGDHSAWIRWNENEPSWTSTPRGALLKCDSGIGSIEVEVNGDYKTHVEWLNLQTPSGPPQMPPRETMIDASYLSNLVGFDVMHPSSPNVKLNALACNMRQAELDGYRQHAIARSLHIEGFDASRRTILKTLPLGQVNRSGHQWDLIFPFARDDVPPIELVAIDIFSGASFDGFVLHYSNGTTSRFGPCGGSPFRMQVGRGDRIQRISVRAGAWIDAVEVVLKNGGSSGMRGNTSGGSLRVLEPTDRRGEIVGLYGTSGDWMDSVGAYTSSPA